MYPLSIKKAIKTIYERRSRNPHLISNTRHQESLENLINIEKLKKPQKR